METATQTLHRLTSYENYDEETVWDPPVMDPRVNTDFQPNDMDRLPWFHKRYAEAHPTVALPRDLPSTASPAITVLGGTADVAPLHPADLDLAQLSRILHLSAGVVRTSPRRYGDHPFRAAGSAGGRFPLEVYVAVPEGCSLPAGVHWYHPRDHALVQVGPAPRADAPVVVVTGVPWRTGWRYRERGFRHIYWDGGTMLSQLMTVAASAGVTPYLYSRFPDAELTSLVGADGIHEWPIAVVSLGAPATVTPTGAGVVGAVDAEPREFSLETAAQRAGDRNAWGAPWAPGEPVLLHSAGATVEDVILRRGSQRLFDPQGILAARVLRDSMRAAMRGVDVPHVVAVHAVDGMEPGLYRWPDLEQPLRTGNLRDELHRFCMDQGLGRDAAFVVVSHTDVARLDDREYREAQLSAGLVEGRLHLLAYAQGASASGMTFVDHLVPALVGGPGDGLLVTCVGVPEYESARGGQPGAPTPVRLITPRD